MLACHARGRATELACAAVAQAQRLLHLDDLRADRGRMDIVDADGAVIRDAVDQPADRRRALPETRGGETHLRSLFHKFAIDHLPQNQKRARLVEMALQHGLVSTRNP